MANFTLDDIRKAADAKYASTNIDLGDGFTVELLNPLRLAKADRDVLTEISDRMEEDGADQAEILGDAIRAAAKSKAAAEKLIEAIDGDLAVLAELFENYTESTQVGEASASQS